MIDFDDKEDLDQKCVNELNKKGHVSYKKNNIYTHITSQWIRNALKQEHHDRAIHQSKDSRENTNSQTPCL